MNGGYRLAMIKVPLATRSPNASHARAMNTSGMSTEMPTMARAASASDGSIEMSFAKKYAAPGGRNTSDGPSLYPGVNHAFAAAMYDFISASMKLRGSWSTAM